MQTPACGDSGASRGSVSSGSGGSYYLGLIANRGNRNAGYVPPSVLRANAKMDAAWPHLIEATTLDRGSGKGFWARTDQLAKAGSPKQGGASLPSKEDGKPPASDFQGSASLPSKEDGKPPASDFQGGASLPSKEDGKPPASDFRRRAKRKTLPVYAKFLPSVRVPTAGKEEAALIKITATNFKELNADPFSYSAMLEKLRGLTHPTIKDLLGHFLRLVQCSVDTGS